jgi:hypothetical protein
MLARPAARWWLVAILVAAGCSRLILALLGGQHHYGDEIRYYRACFALHYLAEGNFTALATFPAATSHAGFTLVSGAIAPVHVALAQLGRDSPGEFLDVAANTPHLAAALLSLFSTLNLWLLYRIARRAGAGREEALWGALLAGVSLTLTVYARHLLPYDASLTFFLLALLAGWRATPMRSALAGAAALSGFTVYNGHWFLVPLVAAVFVWLRRSDPRRVGLAGAWSAGAVVGLAVGYAPALLLGEIQLVSGVQYFASTIRDGDFAEGWSLPFEFLWHAEGGLGLLVLAFAAWAALRRGAPGHVRAWVIAAAAIYGVLVLCSVGLEKFVVYARTVRPIVPLLCLAAGAGLAAVVARRPALRLPLAATIICGAALNLAPFFPLVYPRELDRKVHSTLGVPHDYLTFLNSWDKPPHGPLTRPDLVLVNTYALFGFDAVRPYPAGEVLLDVRHPLALSFYHYDGHKPDQRRMLREHEPRMKLIRLPTPQAVVNAP